MTSLRDEEIDCQEAAQRAAQDGPDGQSSQPGADSEARERPAEGRREAVRGGKPGTELEELEELDELEEPEELDEPDDEPQEGLTPREARRVRAITAAVFMACIAVALIVQVGDEPSLVTIGFYGIGLVLSGVAIKLSYAGRTRLAMAVLGLGLGLVVVVEQILRLL